MNAIESADSAQFTFGIEKTISIPKVNSKVNKDQAVVTF